MSLLKCVLSFALLFPGSLRCGVLSPASLWCGCHPGEVQQGGNVLCVCLCLLRHLSKDLPWSREVSRRETEMWTTEQHTTGQLRPPTVARYTSVFVCVCERTFGKNTGNVTTSSKERHSVGLITQVHPEQSNMHTAQRVRVSTRTKISYFWNKMQIIFTNNHIITQDEYPNLVTTGWGDSHLSYRFDELACWIEAYMKVKLSSISSWWHAYSRGPENSQYPHA